MEKIGIIGGADGPTAIMVSGGGLTMKIAFVLAVIAVIGVIVWVQHRHE